MFKLNFKIALRNLWKNKGYTLINVGGLAIGLASCMILLLYVAYEWSYDKQGKNYENTYIVYNHQKSASGINSHNTTPGALADEIKATIPGVVSASHFSYEEEHLLSLGTHSFKKLAIYADTAFTTIMDFKYLKGNPQKALREVNAVVLTESMAKNLFGDEDPINKIVKLDNLEPLKVDAVIADLPKNSSIQFDYLLSWALFGQHNPGLLNSGFGNNYCQTIVQLGGSQFFEKADQIVHGIYEKHQKDDWAQYGLHPIGKWHLYSDFENGKSVGGKIEQVKIFFLLAFCILLVACVNFMNLSTARSEKRAKEVGVRKAIGSSRKSLIGQFMLESVLLSFLAMLVAFVLIEVSLPYFSTLLKINMEIDYRNWQFWGMFVGLTAITGMVAGSYPAFYLSSFQPLQVLKGFRVAGKASLSVRQVLVVFQFVFAVCLIICTGVIYQQLNFVKNKSIGYNKDNLIEVELQGPLIKNEQKQQLLKTQLLKSGSVTAVSFFSTSVSRGGNNTLGVVWPGKSKDDKTLFNVRSTGYDFVATIGSQMVAGREFSAAYVDTANIIVNEMAVRAMDLKNPVGRVITFGGQPVTIIGVMKDFVLESPYKEGRPLIFYYNTQMVKVLLVRLNDKMDVKTAMHNVNALVEGINPGFPVDAKFADDNFEEKFQKEKIIGAIANWFGGFAIFISCLGLLGLALYMAEQRKKEISIRKVLGASNFNILALLNRDFIKLVAIANLIAFPLAYIIVNKWLEEFSYRIDISVLPFAIALSLSVIIALLTISVQSVKVAKANPVDALKYE
jgi:putative ABC transport system permease protein